MMARRHIFLTAIVLLQSLVIAACASSGSHLGFPNQEDPLYDGVNPAAIHSSNMMSRKSMPNRSRNNFEFYFKHCDLNGDDSFYSKTAYECTEP